MACVPSKKHTGGLSKPWKRLPVESGNYTDETEPEQWKREAENLKPEMLCRAEGSCRAAAWFSVGLLLPVTSFTLLIIWSIVNIHILIDAALKMAVFNWLKESLSLFLVNMNCVSIFLCRIAPPLFLFIPSEVLWRARRVRLYITVSSLSSQRWSLTQHQVTESSARSFIYTAAHQKTLSLTNPWIITGRRILS